MDFLYHLKEFFKKSHNKFNAMVVCSVFLICVILSLVRANPALVILLIGLLILFELFFYKYYVNRLNTSKNRTTNKNKTANKNEKANKTEQKSLSHHVEKARITDRKLAFFMFLILGIYLVFVGIKGIII